MKVKPKFIALLLIADTLLFVGCQDNYQSYHGQTTLMIAARHSQSVKVSALLLSGENVNAIDQQGHTALTYSAQGGDIKIMRLLLMAGANIHYNNDQALVDSILSGHRWGTRYLLEKGADINARQPEGYSILMRAVQGGDTEIAEILIDSGAEVNAKSDYGDTAISLARAKRYPKIVELLKSRGALD
jgi:ankyrin repeat protein